MDAVIVPSFRRETSLPTSLVRWTFALAMVGGLPTAALAQPLGPASSKAAEAPFLAENDTAMSRMMNGMAIKPSGDVDADFAAMMIPHHQGAIEMAEAELRHGRNEILRRIAQEIVVDQQQEIVAMRLALGQALPPSVASPTQPGAMAVSPPAMPMKAKVNP